MSSKPGRNDPCPCGSGRKYKVCCGGQKPAPGAVLAAPPPPPWYPQALGELAAGRVRLAISMCEPAFRANPTQSECSAFADRLLAVVDRDCTAFSRAPSPESAHRVQLDRLQMAEALAALPPGALLTSWPLFARAHARLMNCGLRDFTRAPNEDELLARLLKPLAGSATYSFAAEQVVAAALLARNFELPLLANLDQLPPWLRPTYFSFLLESPQVFNVNGEAERYVDFLEQLTDWVHQSWVRKPDSGIGPATREFAGLFAMHANFTQAYFSARNLRPLYRKRGEIISAYLVSQGVPTLRALAPSATAPSSSAQDGPSRKIKLGIFAHRFTPGTEAYFTLSHFEHLDRERFDVTLYALSFGEHALEKYCADHADRVVVLHATDFSSQIQKIREDRLDMLLISTNMTTHTIVSTLLGSVRLAPIQVASVSSPVTSGASHTDVMLSAAWNEPEADAQEHYTEQLELLPGSVNYYAYQHDHDPVTIDVSREKLGIPADALVFFSGANFFKILPELSGLWARILAAVPNSILLVMPFNPNWGSSYQRLPFFGRIRQQLEARGVAPDRLRAVDTVPTRADVHQVIGLADVYLDAYPFAGACSMLDSILVGIPAVVRRGVVGRSNHGASLLRMVGLEELSCDSDQAYVDKAIALANDPEERRRIREHLQALKQAEVPVYYDTKLFSTRVGTALEKLYTRHEQRQIQLSTDGATLRSAVEEAARKLISAGKELNALTDIGIVRHLIDPYFQSAHTDRPRRMLDVGACHGAMAAPLLARGWKVDLFEPDPGAREVLQRNLQPYAAQIQVHALAAGSTSAESVPFHQAAVQGLSGLADSPFANTATVLNVPCVTLADFCAQQAIEVVDFLKIDAEGYDFDVLDSLDFQRVRPELVLVEYGTHFPRQSIAEVNRAIAAMASRGYGAVVFAYADDGNFKRSVWIYRLTGVQIDREITPQEGESFGNILFYPLDNPRLLLMLHSFMS